MENLQFKVLMLEDARKFLKDLPPKVREKIYYNIRKVQGGVKDIELFKKLDSSEIWEFRTKIKGWHIGCFPFGTMTPGPWW